MASSVDVAETKIHVRGEADRAAALLYTAVRYPSQVKGFSTSDWDLFVRVARAEGLLARSAMQFETAGVSEFIPRQAIDHMLAARAVAKNHARMIRWEVDRIQFALRSTEAPILLLKGAAYLLMELPLAQGRLVSDVDILVPAGALQKVETALLEAGWASLKLDPYDQRYYRRWMHELPPLRHRGRGTTVDVHHRILPQTSRLNPDPRLLWADSTQLAASHLRVLSKEDMLLHCAVHLFHDSDLNHGLRDLLDLHDMFETFGEKPEFWTRLSSRAKTLGVTRPLFYALRYTEQLLGTRIPASMSPLAYAAAPAWLTGRLMDRLVKTALTPQHPDFPSRTTAIARWLLYVRSHYLRMPLRLLIPHLLRKSIRQRPPAA